MQNLQQTQQPKPEIIYYATLLEQAYRQFTRGADLMNGAQFLRFCNETGIMDRSFNKAAVNFMFVKTTDQKVKRLNFNSWKNNFGLIADKKKLEKNDIVKLVEAYAKKKYFNNPFDFVKYPAEPLPGQPISTPLAYKSTPILPSLPTLATQTPKKSSPILPTMTSPMVRKANTTIPSRPTTGSKRESPMLTMRTRPNSKKDSPVLSNRTITPVIQKRNPVLPSLMGLTAKKGSPLMNTMTDINNTTAATTFPTLPEIEI